MVLSEVRTSPSFLTGCDRFATDEALDEIYRVMKEGAVFGMIWNIDDCESIQVLHGAKKPPGSWH